ncbi:uncharacterized protein LOC144629048 isoform X2 [Oculina patagonica]
MMNAIFHCGLKTDLCVPSWDTDRLCCGSNMEGVSFFFSGYISVKGFSTRQITVGLNIAMSSKNAVTIGSLIEKDLKEAYFLLQHPSSYSKGYRFLNDKKYRLFDYPPCSPRVSRILSPFHHLPAAGNEIPIILECTPESYLQQHWKQWLPAFPPAVIKPSDEGLQDDIPLVTTAAFQGIPKHKHSVDPDILYKVQLKSSILDIKAPTPRHMDENAISYPCMVKVDMGYGGLGNSLVKNEGELSAILRQIREVHGWKGGIVFQEFIPGVKEVPNCYFHLHKSGEIFWIGTMTGTTASFTEQYSLSSIEADWGRQEEYEHLLYQEFTLPIKNYLQERGYFGLVNFEVLISDRGNYLVDLNPRIGGGTAHMLLARYMALDFGLKHSKLFYFNKHKTSAKKLVEKANGINKNGEGIVIVLSAADEDEGCDSFLSIFAKTPEMVQTLFHSLDN